MNFNNVKFKIEPLLFSEDTDEEKFRIHILDVDGEEWRYWAGLYNTHLYDNFLSSPQNYFKLNMRLPINKKDPKATLIKFFKLLVLQ